MKTLIIIPKPQTVSDISKDVAQVFFAAMFVDSIVNNKVDWFMTASGLILSLVFWSASIFIAKK